MPGLAATHPSAEDYEDFVLHARYGDLADLQSWLANFGREAAAVACDENDNTALHMAAANGHEGLFCTLLRQKTRTLMVHAKAIVKVLLDLLPHEGVIRQNHGGNTALHWAAMKCARITLSS